MPTALQGRTSPRRWRSRAIAFADLDLFVNTCSAAVLIFGLGRFLQRFGVTASLALSPILMFFACIALAFAPTFFVVQSARALQRISQYAIARPSREVLFTVLDQQSKYKAKNVIDTSVYRFGDLTAAWLQAGRQARLRKPFQYLLPIPIVI